MPLRRAFVSLVLVMAVLVAGISAVTIFTCVNVQNQILESVTDYQVLPPQETEDEYNLVIADDEQIVPGENGQLVILSTEYQIANLSDTQRVAYYAAKAAVVLVPTLLFVLGTIFCAWMFYSIKLKQPLSLLLQSADRISQSDLDFCLDYPASDEMGELCRAMDTMRAALLKNNQETWAMMEERRKLSASIAHDLRTPITVMKGYTEYLSHNVPLGRISEDKLMDTIHNLSLATDRLEQYANQVREIQAMDAIPVKRAACPLREFFEEQEDEYAVITTFGKPSVVSTSGLKFKIPIIQQKTIVSKATQGFALGYDLRTNVNNEDESLMISVDFNFVNVDFYVEYRVDDPVKYLYNSEEPEAILKMLCQSYIRDTIGLYGVDDIITTGKAEIQGVIRDKISTRLEQEDIGLVLVNIALQDAEPPTLEVQQAFKAVETSKQEAETAINNANKYANEQLPAAKANADEILQQAEAYKESRIAEAEGQASRFTELYAEYSKYPEITRQRLFYEMIAKVFPDMKIVITGRDGSTLQTVLPLESFTGTNTTTTTGEEP